MFQCGVEVSPSVSQARTRANHFTGSFAAFCPNAIPQVCAIPDRHHQAGPSKAEQGPLWVRVRPMRPTRIQFCHHARARHTLPFAILAPAPSRDSLIVFASARACVLRQVSKGAGTSGPPSSRARPQVIWCARPPSAECCPQLCTQTTPPLRLLTLVCSPLCM